MPGPTLEQLLESRGARTYADLALAAQEGSRPRLLRETKWLMLPGLLLAFAMTVLPVVGAQHIGLGDFVGYLITPVYFLLSLFGISHVIDWLDRKRDEWWRQSVRTLAERLESVDEKFGPFPKSPSPAAPRRGEN